MTILTKSIHALKSAARKTAALADAVIELPNAALACVEMAREAEYFRGQREIGNSPAATEERKTWNEIVDRQNKRVRELTDKLAAVDAELAREREARRERRQRDEPAPPAARVLERYASGSVCVCRGSAVDFLSTWRYLSPEDMP